MSKLPDICPKLLLFLFVFMMQPAVSQTKTIYPELELYRLTFAPEQAAAYQKALEEYHNTPAAEKLYSANAELNRRYKEIKSLPQATSEQTNLKTNEFYSLLRKAAKKRDTNLELESLLQAFTTAFWSESPNYYKAFEMAVILERKLSLVTEDTYPDKRAAYFKLGEAYYLFKDFEKSIELLKHAVTDNPPRSFTDCANLDARKVIGICYANINQMDTSDYYFQSTLKSADIVLNRPVYNAFALSHLACNAMMKGEYERSLALDLEVLPFLKGGDDYGHVAGMYACQCFSYFGLEESSKIAGLADSILYYAQKDTYNKSKRLKQAYTILAKYNANRGNADKAQEYNDSLINIYMREEKLYNSQYIVQARKKVGENEIAARKAEVEAQRLIVFIIFGVFILSVGILSVIVVLYRRKEAAYRALVRKNIEWAASSGKAAVSSPSDSGSGADGSPGTGKKAVENHNADDMAIMSLLLGKVVENKLYTSPDITLDAVSKRLKISAKRLSKALNSIEGKNFNAFINEYRVKEAVRLLSDPANDRIDIAGIGHESGFNSRSTFYESFRKITGLLPTEFRKSKRNMSGFTE